MKIWLLDLGYKHKLASNLTYDMILHAQYNKTPLTLQDRFSIGGLYSVRGFDGQMSLVGQKGLYIRNTLSYNYINDHSIYLALGSGVLAVQALSRLNRAAPKYSKKTEDLFVLDFFNKIEDIKASFDPFYTSTSLKEETDINVLHELKAVLDDSGIYERIEVDEFFDSYFKGEDAGKLSAMIDLVADRFNSELEDDDKADYKIKAKQFVKIYAQMASIMPYEIVAWERLFWFLKFLVPKMIVKDKDKDRLDELLNAVDLSTYGLERVKLGAKIELNPNETKLDPQNPNLRGAHADDEKKDPLDEIIKNFNEKWFKGWDATPEEQRAKFIHIMDKVKAHKDFEQNYEKNTDEINKKLAIAKIIDEVINNERKKELELYKLFATNETFKLGLMENIERALRAGV